MRIWTNILEKYPRASFVLIIGLCLSAAAFFLMRVGDRVIASRHTTAIRIGDAYTAHHRFEDTHGVSIIRADGRLESLQSDVLHDHFAKTGLHSAEASGWRDRIVSVQLGQRRIEVGESLRYELLMASILAGMPVMATYGKLRARRRRKRPSSAREARAES